MNNHNHNFRSNKLFIKFSPIFFTLSHTFFTIFIEVHHLSCWFLFDPSSTSVCGELFATKSRPSLKNWNCHHQVHSWLLDHSHSWCIIELRYLLHSLPTSSNCIYFGIVDLETRGIINCIIKRLNSISIIL